MTVLIPAYMPDEKLYEVIDGFAKTDYKIIVVDDGSGEEYKNIFENLPKSCVLLTHTKNMGKGQALKTGFKYILECGEETQGVVMVDADGQHLPEDAMRVAGAIGQDCDFCIGVRKFVGKVPFRSRFGNRITQFVFFLASGKWLHDTQTGLRAVSTRVLHALIGISGERYEYEMNMLLELTQKGVRMKEEEIKTVYLDHNKSSHFNPLTDSFKIYSVIFKFALSSFAAFLIDFLVFMLLAGISTGLAKEMSLLISTVGARIISSLCNYLINKKAVFAANGQSYILRYYLVAAVVLGCNYLLIFILNDLIGVPTAIAKLLTEITMFVFSFIAQRAFVFKGKGV